MGGVWLWIKPTELPGDRFEIGSVIVNLTGKNPKRTRKKRRSANEAATQAGRNMRWPKLKLKLEFRPVERFFAEESAAETLAQIESGTAPGVALVWLPLMQGSGEAGLIARWLTRASQEEMARRRELASLVLVFAELAGCHAAWSKALEGWNVTESKQVLEWQRMAAEPAERRGEERGRAEGEARGEVKGQTNMLVEGLRIRFRDVPSELVAALEAVSPDRHRELLAATIQCASLDDFRTRTGL